MDSPEVGQAGHPGLVHAQVIDGVGLITLDDPSRRNSLSAVMLQQLQDALARFRTDKVRVVVLGDRPDAKVFSAGHNIRELRTDCDPLSYDEPLERALRAIRSYPGPVIVMVHGSVWGGAFDLVCSCDLVVADETSEFAITPANLGLPYNMTGLLHLLNRLPLNLIKEMFFSAEPISAEQAKEWHIVNHLVPAGQLMDFTMDLARKMTAKAPLSIAVVKEQLRILTDEHAISAQAAERIEELRRYVWQSKDYKEGIAAFFEKRHPVFKGE
jgi:methylmalonyl-CoA decarboxylase